MKTIGCIVAIFIIGSIMSKVNPGRPFEGHAVDHLVKYDERYKLIQDQERNTTVYEENEPQYNARMRIEALAAEEAK